MFELTFCCFGWFFFQALSLSLSSFLFRKSDELTLFGYLSSYVCHQCGVMWYFSQLCINTEIFDEMETKSKWTVVYILFQFFFLVFCFCSLQTMWIWLEHFDCNAIYFCSNSINIKTNRNPVCALCVPTNELSSRSMTSLTDMNPTEYCTIEYLFHNHTNRSNYQQINK